LAGAVNYLAGDGAFVAAASFAVLMNHPHRPHERVKKRIRGGKKTDGSCGIQTTRKSEKAEEKPFSKRHSGGIFWPPVAYLTRQFYMLGLAQLEALVRGEGRRRT
jgi:hypothetical protein